MNDNHDNAADDKAMLVKLVKLRRNVTVREMEQSLAAVRKALREGAQAAHAGDFDEAYTRFEEAQHAAFTLKDLFTPQFTRNTLDTDSVAGTPRKDRSMSYESRKTPEQAKTEAVERMHAANQAYLRGELTREEWQAELDAIIQTEAEAGH